MKQDGLTIAFVGGGTGGHVTPIVSLIEYAQNHSDIKSKCKQLYWFGETDSLESQACASLSDVIFVPVIAGKLRRYRDLRALLQNIWDGIKVVGAFFQAVRKLYRHNIDVVFCKGGYVALPVCRAARVLGKKVMLHESDLHPGLVNRLVSRFATKMFTGFPGTFDKEIVVGQLLSQYLLQTTVDSPDAKTQVLVMGGSQGSEALLQVVDTYVQQSSPDDIHITCILGTKNMLRREKLEKYPSITLYDRVDQNTLGALYHHTDIAITRAGVTSLAEQQLFGIKKIIVPHPYGGGDHQLANALWYGEKYDDIVVEQDEQLIPTITMFLDKLRGRKKEPHISDAGAIEAPKKIIWEHLTG